MHHIVTPGFVNRPRWSDCTAGQMDGEAGWWTTSGNIGLPPLARVMGVGRQQQEDTDHSFHSLPRVKGLGSVKVIYFIEKNEWGKFEMSY